jgi:hypothetical protein
MTPELITAIAGILLSLLFEFVPGFESWYGKFSKQQKRLFMVGALFLVVGGAFALSCLGIFAYFVCSGAGAWTALQAFILALIANQTVHLVFKKE